MSVLAQRSVTLSLAILLASTSLSHAGFIWLSPDQKPNDGATYSQQAEPATPADANVQGRAWPVDPSVPVAGTQPEAAPVAMTADTAPASTDVAPVGISGTAPVAPVQASDAAPAVVAPVAAAPVVLGSGPDNTMSGTPVYARGDAKPAAPVEMTAAEPAPAVVPETTAPAVSAPVVAAAPAEVTLASSRNIPQPTPASQQGATSATAMPGAEAMISSMPSMTAPHGDAAPVSAPVAVAPAPVVAAEAAAPAPVVPMLSPATVPMTSAASAAPAPSTEPAQGVSTITGQTVAATSPAPAATETAQAADDSQKTVAGFGKHVPLVIAMRQILPAGYGFAHADGVDLTSSVDWQGGRPWPQVLTDAIKPIGLTANINGDTVMLEKAQVAMAPELTPPEVNPVPAAQLAPGQAILTNATVMQTPPSND